MWFRVSALRHNVVGFRFLIREAAATDGQPPPESAIQAKVLARTGPRIGSSRMSWEYDTKRRLGPSG